MLPKKKYSMTEVLKELVTSKPSTNLNEIIDTIHNESLIALRARLWFAGNTYSSSRHLYNHKIPSHE